MRPGYREQAQDRAVALQQNPFSLARMLAQSRHLMTLRRQAIVFGAAVVAVSLAAIQSADLAFAFYYAAPERYSRAEWWVWALNVFAPALGGALVVAVLIAWESRRARYTCTWQGHLARTTSWYVAAGVLYWIVWMDRGISDFGLWGQIIEWPLAGLLAAIATDVLASAWGARTQRRAVSTALV
jgi:hypothetical protein